MSNAVSSGIRSDSEHSSDEENLQPLYRYHLSDSDDEESSSNSNSDDEENSNSNDEDEDEDEDDESSNGDVDGKYDSEDNRYSVNIEYDGKDNDEDDNGCSKDVRGDEDSKDDNKDPRYGVDIEFEYDSKDTDEDNNIIEEPEIKSHSPRLEDINPQRALYEFLSRCETRNTDVITHTTLPESTQIRCKKYNIPVTAVPEFYRLYTLAVANGFKEPIVERPPKDVDMYIIDIDFRYTPEQYARGRYSPQIIIDFIQCHNEIIRRLFDVDESLMTAYVFEKPEPTIKKDGVVGDGFHIFYADMPLEVTQKEMLYNEGLALVTERRIFDSLDLVKREYKEIYDCSVVKANGIIMYGSCKTGAPEYELTAAYDAHLNLIDHLPLQHNYQYFSIRKFSETERTTPIKYTEAGSKLVDKYHSIATKKTKTRPKPKSRSTGQSPELQRLAEYRQNDYNFNASDLANTTSVNDNDDPYGINTIPIVDIDERKEIKFIRKILTLLPYGYVDEYRQWTQVAAAMVNQSPKYFPLFYEFSDRELQEDRTRFNCSMLDGCINEWEKYKNVVYDKKKLTIKSIQRWAKEADPIKYFNALDERTQIIEGCENKTDERLATYIKEEVGDSFVCVDCTKQQWYHYSDPRWKSDISGVAMRNYIASRFAFYYERRARFYFSKRRYLWQLAKTINPSAIKTEPQKYSELLDFITVDRDTWNEDEDEQLAYDSEEEFLVKRKSRAEAEDEMEQDELVKKIHRAVKRLTEKKNNCTKISMALESEHKISSVLKACARKLYDSEFEARLDADPNLVGFENGVYDLAQRRFRPAQPTDYISLSTKYNYQEYTLDHPDVQFMIKYFETTQPNKETREFILKFIAGLFYGKNKEQTFNFWTGSGKNGKSVTIDFIKSLMGKYAMILNNNVLTTKQSSPGAAAPELANGIGKRLVIMLEPDYTDRIQAGIMKSLSGGDSICCRKLYANPIEYKPMFKIINVCNDLPAISASDEGTKRRLLAMPWKVKFMSQPTPGNTSEAKAVDNIDEYLKNKEPAFFWYLMHEYYPQYISCNLLDVAPPEVLAKTAEYQLSNDLIAQFFHDAFDIVPNVSGRIAKITMPQAHARYKDWMQRNNPNRQPYNKEQFSVHLATAAPKHVDKTRKFLTGVIFKDEVMD